AISSGMLGGGTLEHIDAGGRSQVVSRIPAGDGLLDTLGLPLVRGRAFDASEMNGRSRVAILGERAARRLVPDGHAVGLRVHETVQRDLLVIGVCRDAIDYGPLATADAYAPSEMYVPYEAPAPSADGA